MKTKFATREEWLAKATEILRADLFKPKKLVVPKHVKLSCGFPSARAFQNGQ